LSAEV